jgi:hypothetical protein
MAVQLFLSVSNVQERKCLLDPVDKKRNALARLRLERWAVEMNLESWNLCYGGKAVRPWDIIFCNVGRYVGGWQSFQSLRDFNVSVRALLSSEFRYDSCASCIYVPKRRAHVPWHAVSAHGLISGDSMQIVYILQNAHAICMQIHLDWHKAFL